MTTQRESPDELAEFTELLQHEEEFPSSRSQVDPVLRRRRRRRALLVSVIVIALIVGVVGGYTGWALTAPLPAPDASSHQPPVPAGAPADLALPVEGAAAISVSGADEYLGDQASGIWATAGSGDPRPIASLTKLITALVILDAKPLAGPADPGPTITFTKAAHDLYDKYYVLGATIVSMPTGSSMSQRDALATMLVPSASNYAEAVSTWAFGSQWAFLEATRRWLAEHGLTGTTVVEPTGISPQNTSTPADLMALARLAAADPVIADLVGKSSVRVPGHNPFANTNTLLGTSGVTGLKTGNLGAGTYNLLYTASLDVGLGEPLSVVGVMLGGSSRQSVNTDVLLLLDSIRAGFHEIPVATRGQELGTYTTPWGSSARLVVAGDASIFTWSDTPITVEMETTTPKKYADGEDVGTLTWTAGPRTETVAVELRGDITPPTDWWRLTHPAELGG
ncbi:D-alanyl-D-alanine carboxypeptidase family protein [Microbacterium sp. HJ5]